MSGKREQASVIDNPNFEQSREEVIESHLGLVNVIAMKYRQFGKVNNIDFEDLYSYGCEGLVKAYNRFDPTGREGVKFSYFAYSYIKGEILRAIRDKGGHGVRITRNAKEIYFELHKEGITDVTFEYLKERFSPTTSTIAQVLQMLSGEMSVDSLEFEVTESNASNGAKTLHDIIGVTDSDIDTTGIRLFLSSFDERDRRIVEMRMDGYSQEEIGEELGMSQMHISRLLKRFKEKIEAFLRFGYESKYQTPEDYLKSAEARKPVKNYNKEEGEEMSIENTNDPKLFKMIRNMKNKGYEDAIPYLEDPSIPVSEIADNTGLTYGNLHYYVTQYDKYTGQERARSSNRSKSPNNVGTVKKEAEVTTPDNTIDPSPEKKDPVKKTVKVVSSNSAEFSDISVGGECSDIEELKNKLVDFMKMIPKSQRKSLLSFEVSVKLKENGDNKQ